jgi:hypothetical protein
MQHQYCQLAVLAPTNREHENTSGGQIAQSMDLQEIGLSIGLGWIRASRYYHENRRGPRPNFDDMLLKQTLVQLAGETGEKL